MSEWYEVKDEDDVDLSDDKKFVDIMFDTDYFGSRYVQVPVEMLVKLLTLPEPEDEWWDCECGISNHPFWKECQFCKYPKRSMK